MKNSPGRNNPNTPDARKNKPVLVTKLYRLVLFTREIIKNPKIMGAACPSSPRLARQMAAAVPIEAEGIIIELGGGTGAITNAILKRGVDPARLYVIELSGHLCKILRERFPGINVIQGDAANLEEWFGPDIRIAAVVSGLPLRSLPKKNVLGISRALNKVMPKGCTFIQFTYALPRKCALGLNMEKVRSNIVWNNIPPARVDVSCFS